MGMPAGTSMVTIKRPEEIARMRHAGSILADVLDAFGHELRAGISTADLDALAERMIRDAGAVPSFLGYRGASSRPATWSAWTSAASGRGGTPTARAPSRWGSRHPGSAS